MESEKLHLLLAVAASSEHERLRELAENSGFLAAALHTLECLWTEEDRKRAKGDFENKVQDSPYFKFLVHGFNTPGHFKIVDSHRGFLLKTFERLGRFCPSVTKEQISAHDLSKYSLEQTIGYTARWVHGVDWNNSMWQTSLKDHFSSEKHHPEYFYPAVDEMPREFLEESFLDMVASRWERQLGGADHVTDTQLVDFDPAFLSRYSSKDKVKVEDIVELVKNEEQT